MQCNIRVAGPENVGVAFGISLLSCLEAENYVMIYAIPIYGGHHGSTTSGYFRQQWQYGRNVQLVKRPRIYRGSHCICDYT